MVSVVVLDPRTPVLVGAGAAMQRVEEPGGGVDVLELMAAACEAAAQDAGAAGLLGAVERVMVPRGTWPFADPGRWLAARFGADGARTVVAELGVLQQSLITRACADVAAGRADMVLVVGGEAAYRRLRARIAGVSLPERVLGVDEGGAAADDVWAPDGDVISRLEVERGLAVPARQYALIESALRASSGLPVAEHAREVAALWSGFSDVARGFGGAWRRGGVSVADLVDPQGRNAMLAAPYSKWHCSQMNVDQAAALLVCSVGAAQRFGVGADRWVFPVAAAESNVMVPVVARAEVGRSPGFAVVGDRLAALAGVSVADADVVDLYSCFPAAVRVQVRELGLEGRSAGGLTVTGGMAFGGGPLNNYVLQSTAAVVGAVRACGGVGAVTAVSGMVTKQAGAVWSARPAVGGFRWEDVSGLVGPRSVPLPVVAGWEGPGVVRGATVAFEEGAAALGVVVVDVPGGGRSVAVSREAGVLAAMADGEWVGRSVKVGTQGVFTVG